MNKDFINILRDIRGSAAPGTPATDGIWYELTAADKNGNSGIYGDILAKYGVVTESAGTFDQAVAILENLNVVVTTLPAGAEATSALVNGVWQLGIPRGTAGIDGVDGFTPGITINYTLGNLNYIVTVDGVQITNTALLNLDGLVDTIVNTNVDVQATLVAKQDVLDAVADAQVIADGLDANVAAKIVEISAHTVTKIGELSTASDNEKVEIGVHSDAKVAEYDANAVIKTHQYNDNHEVKLAAYNANDTTKLAQYNANHIERLENLDEKYATRIIDMLNTNKILGMIDKFAAEVPTQYATFIDTANGDYMYYLNGVLLVSTTEYVVINSTTIELTDPIAYGDIVTQVDSRYIGDYLAHEGVLLEERIGQPNGVAGLDGSGKVPAAQLPSYVDDVIEVPTKAALPVVGESSKIYVVVADETSGGDTSSYRWAGSTYAIISNSLTAVDIKALYESVANKVLTSVNSLQFSGGTGTQGTMSWNADEETVDLVQNGAVLQLGQEVHTHVRNTTASTISSGKVVMVTGTIGASGRITVGLYDGVSEVKYILGVCTEDIAAGDDGKVTHFGKVRGVNTSAWNEGDLLYPTTNGGFTNVAPASGVRLALAIVITKHATNGTIMVRANGVNENAYEPKNANIQTHITSTSNPHAVTKAQVGLGSADNTADVNKNVLSATKWATGRTITIGATGKTVDGSGNVSWSLAEIGAQASGNYQPLDATLTALAGVTTAADKVIYATGIDTFGTSTLSAFGRTLIDDADATAARSTLGLVIGTNVQAYDAGLLSVAGLTTAADKMIYTTASDVYATATLTAAGRALIADADAATQRATLGISATNTPSTPVGGISATNVQAAIQELDSEKANTANPVFTGNVTGLGVATGTSFNAITGLASVAPLISSTAAVGTSTAVARQDHVHPAQTTITGNAGTATTLQTARTINGVSFNGSANINIEDRLGTPIASAATTTIGTAGLGDYIHITGTTTITSFGTATTAGIRRTLIFDGALTITHNATSLICLGAENIVTVAGTVIEVVAETTANWRVLNISHPSVGMLEIGYLNGVTSAIQAQINNTVKLTGDETKSGVLTLADGLKLQGQNISPFSGFKNYIINGKKVVNQRGLTSTNNSYNQDRWYKVGNNWFQGIEGDNNLISGKTYTLSWLGASTASYYVGTATSATINAQSFTSIANGGSFTLTISTGQNLWIKFESDAIGSTFNFVQLEEGSVATPFENRPVGLELSLCQRYLPLKIKAGFYGSYGSGYVSIGSTTAATITIPFATTPRSLVSSLLTNGNFELVDGNTVFPVTSFSIDTNNTDSRVLSLNVTCSGGVLTAGSACTLRSANSPSSYILVSNEL